MSELKERLAEINPEALFADGLDDALIGYDSKGRAVYDADKMTRIFMERDGMTEEVAREHFEFNVEQAYVGDYTPIYVFHA